MTTPPTLLFLGTKQIGLACLEWLHAEQARLPCSLRGVLTSDTPRGGGEIRRFCTEHAIEVFDSPAAMPEADFLISVQYHRILQPADLAKARIAAANLHMAPLPEYRGCNQFSFAILHGDTEFGTTLHRMTPGIDSGDILAERRFPIGPDLTVDELYAKTYDATLELFRASLGPFLRGELTPVPQASLAATRPRAEFHRRNEIDALKQIDLSWPEERILRHLRATSMPGFEPPYAIIGGRKVYLVPAEQAASGPSHRIVS